MLPASDVKTKEDSMVHYKKNPLHKNIQKLPKQEIHFLLSIWLKKKIVHLPLGYEATPGDTGCF